MKHTHVLKNRENGDVFIGKAGKCLESVFVNADLLNLNSVHLKHSCVFWGFFSKANS